MISVLMAPATSTFERTQALEFILSQELHFTRTIWKQVTEDITQFLLLISRECGLNILQKHRLIRRWRKLSQAVLNARHSGATIEQIEESIVKFGTSLDFNIDQLKLVIAISRLASISEYLTGDTAFLIENDYFSMFSQLQHSHEVLEPMSIDTIRAQEAYTEIFHQNEYDINSYSIPLGDHAIDTTIVWDVFHATKEPDAISSELFRITTHRMVVIYSDMEDKYSRSLNIMVNWLLSHIFNIGQFQSLCTKRELEAIADIFDWEIIQDVSFEFDPALIPARYAMAVLEPKSASM